MQKKNKIHQSIIDKYQQSKKKERKIHCNSMHILFFSLFFFPSIEHAQLPDHSIKRDEYHA